MLLNERQKLWEQEHLPVTKPLLVISVSLMNALYCPHESYKKINFVVFVCCHICIHAKANGKQPLWYYSQKNIFQYFLQVPFIL